MLLASHMQCACTVWNWEGYGSPVFYNAEGTCVVAWIAGTICKDRSDPDGQAMLYTCIASYPRPFF